jgi:hypothetical protein
MNFKHLKTFESFSKPESKACTYCDENGESECYVCAGYGTMDCCTDPDCSRCGGDGITTCYACSGTRKMPCSCQDEDYTPEPAPVISKPKAERKPKSVVTAEPEDCGYCDENGESECYVCAGYGTMDCCGDADCGRCGGDGITTCNACSGSRRIACDCQEEK